MMTATQAATTGDKVGVVLATLLVVAATWVYVSAYQHIVSLTDSTYAGYAGAYIILWTAAKFLRGILQPLQSI